MLMLGPLQKGDPITRGIQELNLSPEHPTASNRENVGSYASNIRLGGFATLVILKPCSAFLEFTLHTVLKTS